MQLWNCSEFQILCGLSISVHCVLVLNDSKVTHKLIKDSWLWITMALIDSIYIKTLKVKPAVSQIFNKKNFYNNRSIWYESVPRGIN